MRLGLGGASGTNDTAVHDTLGPVRMSVRELGNDPDTQVSLTISLMKERACQDAVDPAFNAWAVSICGDGGSDMDKIGAAYAHVKNALTFKRDELQASQLQGVVGTDDAIEVIIRPLDMMRYVQAGTSTGDCDDFSMYLAALLESVGVPCSFVTVAADAQAPRQYSHVYVAAYPDVNGERIRVPLDASHGDGVGWEAEQVVEVRRKREWSVGGNLASLFVDFAGAIFSGIVAWYLCGVIVKELKKELM